MMNLGPPPPPPPPPFSTGPPAPAPKPPAEVPSKATPPTIAPPAALAGAMLKDKKPFTYTPGGINLAEINAQSATQQNGNPSPAHHTGRSDPIQSKSFKVIAGAYDNHDSAGNLTQNAVPEPKKYTGSNIPSRSFRMLQAMTDTDDDDPNATPDVQGDQWADERSSHAETSSSCSKSTTTLSSPPLSLSSSSLVASSSAFSNNKQRDIGSRVAPSYTSISDSHVYRQVVPKIVNKTLDERVVNSALSAKRDSSPRPWQRFSREASPITVVTPANDEGEPETPTELESPSRLLHIIKQEKSDSGSETCDKKLLYDGSHIPSRVFRQLQNDYSDKFPENESVSSGSSHSSSIRVTEVPLPRFMQHLHIDQKRGSSEDEQYHNGVLDTAYAKESVLKELTSQFDPQTNLKKPKAAPGRVFRYLQQQYDDPQDSDFASMDSNLNSRSTSTTPNNVCLSPTSSGTYSNNYDVEAKPKEECRVPGRTFRLLQENIQTHPSVLQARK